MKKTGSRIVFVFPRLGLVVKVPRIHLLVALRTVVRFRKGGISWRDICSLGVESSGSPQLFLFKGLRDNWMERSFYKSSPCRDFLQPTVFSLLGLVNLQLYGEIIPQEEFDGIESQLYFFSNNEVWRDHHHFEAGNNFCRVGDRLKMVDYGSPRTREIISKWGEVFLKEIDVSSIVRSEK